jgi:tetratricopeptide (TPR) repeat protein
MVGSETKPFVFVSSFTEENESLRSDIFDMGQSLGRYTWVCENKSCRPDLYGREPLEICDTLMDRVREARLYIAIIGGSRRGEREHGTAVMIGDRVSATSHFEIELFQAALLGKPVELFISKGFSPGPRLRALLEILEFALPNRDWRAPMGESEIRLEIEHLLQSKRLLEPNPLGRRRNAMRENLVARFYRERGRPSHKRLRFLNGEYEQRSRLPDKDLIKDLIAKAASTPDQERKLARLWLVIRELMPAAPSEPRFAEYLPFWDQALGSWGSAAAWYGLHAHLYLGGLAALQSVADVRALLRDRDLSRAVPAETAPPSTALASALYSIAKLAPTWSDRRALLDEALGHLNVASVDSSRTKSNVLALRGSILLKQFRISEAVSAFEQALRLRTVAGESQARIGESMSELGFAYLWQGRLWKGRDLMQKGVENLSDHENGFLVRARRKLAVGYTLTGCPMMARREREKGDEIARAHRMFDQL